MPIDPFTPTTTPVIERANRLLSLRDHPGFIDIVRLANEIVVTATDVLITYGGWDTQQISVLKARAQAATEFRDLLFVKIREAIQSGLEEGRAQSQNFPEKTAEEILEQGDHVRQKVLEKFEEYDSRPAGSF